MQVESVLVIDDEPDVREVVGMTLSALGGWEVLGASSGWEGLIRARNHLPDVILLDVMMPDMNGVEVLELLRCNPATCSIPVIFMTAKSRFGGDNVILKPFEPTTLIDRIGAIVEHWASPDDQTEVPGFAAKLQGLWERYRLPTLEKVDALEEALCAIMAGERDPAMRVRACDSAHQLTGTAGLFGMAAAGARCREIEGALDAKGEVDAQPLLRLASLLRVDFGRESLSDDTVAA